jgi:hypothetical protein
VASSGSGPGVMVQTSSKRSNQWSVSLLRWRFRARSKAGCRDPHSTVAPSRSAKLGNQSGALGKSTLGGTSGMHGRPSLQWQWQSWLWMRPMA